MGTQDTEMYLVLLALVFAVDDFWMYELIAVSMNYMYLGNVRTWITNTAPKMPMSLLKMFQQQVPGTKHHTAFLALPHNLKMRIE